LSNKKKREQEKEGKGKKKTLIGSFSGKKLQDHRLGD
jgi:hypothetical protein